MNEHLGHHSHKHHGHDGDVQPEAGTAVKIFFLACVIIAGLYGGLTASRKIVFVQALPAAIALALVLASS